MGRAKTPIFRPLLSRRELLSSLAPAAVLLAAGRADAQTELPHVDEKDPIAKGLGYVPDVKKVDPKAEPTLKTGAHCANCVLLQGKAGDTWRPCNMFPGKVVNANGWCKAWVQNPAVK
jgi:hypothetical protein